MNANLKFAIHGGNQIKMANEAAAFVSTNFISTLLKHCHAFIAIQSIAAANIQFVFAASKKQINVAGKQAIELNWQMKQWPRQ